MTGDSCPSSPLDRFGVVGRERGFVRVEEVGDCESAEGRVARRREAVYGSKLSWVCCGWVETEMSRAPGWSGSMSARGWVVGGGERAPVVSGEGMAGCMD